MIAKKLKTHIAVLVVVALAASTALHFHSWLEVASGEDWESFESARRALAARPNRNSRTAYERAYTNLVQRGLDPHSRRFNRVLRKKVEAKQRVLHQSREYHLKRKENQRSLREDGGKVRGEKKTTTTDVMQNLRENMEIWLRGDFLLRRGEYVSNARGRSEEVEEAKTMAELNELQKLDENFKPLTVCDRPADVGAIEDFRLLQRYAQCPKITPGEPILLLKGGNAHGRTGNNIIEFLHAIQEARDDDIQLGVMSNSWAMDLLLKMWMAIQSPTWQVDFEKAFCVKVFHDPAELEGWDVIHKDTKDLFWYLSDTPLGEYIESQEYWIRTLFRNYNTGKGINHQGFPVKDMCSGIDSIFGEDKESAIYSVIHSRTLEGDPGLKLLKKKAHTSGCDREAALEMRPDYIKSILEPLGMMKFPIVFIADGQNPDVLKRLMADPEIGPLIRIVPEEACWIGGDLTLGVMSNVFIGNPASSFTSFIAKARLALGFGHNYLFRAKDENGKWRTVCGDHCIFDRSIMGVQA